MGCVIGSPFAVDPSLISPGQREKLIPCVALRCVSDPRIRYPTTMFWYRRRGCPDGCGTLGRRLGGNDASRRGGVERFEWYCTPKHVSWLSMAESELSVLSGQCLDRRIPDRQTLTEEVAAWEDRRKRKHAKADWQFTTADARVKLKRLYPAM